MAVNDNDNGGDNDVVRWVRMGVSVDRYFGRPLNIGDWAIRGRSCGAKTMRFVSRPLREA